MKKLNVLLLSFILVVCISLCSCIAMPDIINTTQSSIENTTIITLPPLPQVQTTDYNNIASTDNFTYEIQTTDAVTTQQQVIIETTQQQINVETTQQNITEPIITQPVENQFTTTLPNNAETNMNQEQTLANNDYSAYSKEQILTVYSQALNKTRAYTNPLNVHHTESFVADVKEAHPGGELTTLLVNNIVKLVGSEGEQDLVFNNGRANNKDGETVPILLPQKTEFALSPSGVSSATIQQEGDKIHVIVTLVPETVSMGGVPTHNASSIGYLDTSSMDFKIIKISRVDINYTGSVIDAYIRADGYIESVNYTINMSTYAELSGMGITGSGTLEGAQTEKWELKW